MSNNATELDYTLTRLLESQKQILSKADNNAHSTVRIYFAENNKMAYYEPLQFLLNNTKTANEVVVKYAELTEKFAEFLDQRKKMDDARLDEKNIILDRLKGRDSLKHLSRAVMLEKIIDLLHVCGGLELEALTLKKTITDKLSVYVSSLETMNKFNAGKENTPPEVMRYFAVVQMNLETRKSLAADLTYLLEQMEKELTYLRKLRAEQEESILMRDIESSVATIKGSKNLEGISYLLYVVLNALYYILTFIIIACSVKAFYWLISAVIPYSILDNYISYPIVILSWVVMSCSLMAVAYLVACSILKVKQTLPIIYTGIASLFLIYYSSSIKLDEGMEYANISIVSIIITMVISFGLMIAIRKPKEDAKKFHTQFIELRNLFIK